MVFKFRSLVVFLSAVLLAGVPSFAQQSLGAINGVVTDSSGGVMRDVRVTVRNTGTNLEVTGTTNSEGSFTIVDLPIGTYVVTFTKGNFNTEVHSQILVRGNFTTTVNGRLQPGNVESTVTVTATPLLNQTDTTNGYVLGELEINTTPLGTGSFTQLATLAPGVSADPLSGSGTNAGLGNQNIFANGQRDTSNSFSFNSVDSNNIFNGLSSSAIGESRFILNTNEQFHPGGQVQTNSSVFDAIGQGLPSPPAETIEELHVNTSMYDVSQGANSGAHIAVATKSGTNEFHGQAYEYHQTDAWNANQFFLNAVPIPRQPLHRNTFGGTLGGPIKRNKLFFFGSYQGQRVTDAANGSIVAANVPTGLTDDRSAATLAALAGVDPTKIDNAALMLMQAKGPNGKLLIPSQNITDPNTINIFGGNAFEIGPASTFKADQVNGNVDYLFSTKDRLAGKYYFQNDPSTNPFAVSQVAGFPQTLHAGSQVISLDNTVSLTPNATWEQRFGFARQIANATTTQQLTGLTPASLGINLLGGTIFPGITISRPSGSGNDLGIGPANNFANAGAFQNHFQGSTNYNWIVGRHTISFGFAWDYAQLNVLNRENQVASFNFSSFANFLTGTLGGRNGGLIVNGETNRYFRAKQAGTFIQDNFKVASNLTITAGVRWDWDGPLVEKNGLLTNFYKKNYSFDLASDTINNIGLVVAGNNKQFCATKSTFCANDSTLTGRQWLFEPRIGIAWSPGFAKNVVVRAGFGLYADRGEFFTEFSPSAGIGVSGPFGVTAEQPFSALVNTSCKGAQCLSNNPFGTAPLSPPPHDLSGVAALVHNLSALSGCPEPVTPTCTPTAAPPFAFLFGGYDPRNTLPYSENWTLDVQWQPFNTLLLDVGYVGNRGLHQLLPIPFNQPGIATPSNPINGQIYSYGYQATDADGGPGVLLTEQAATTIASFAGADGNTALRVPFVGYNPNSDFWEAEGVSSYHALQVSAKKRMSHGLLINASYTWSHTLDEGSGISEGLFFNGNNPLNPRSAYGNSGFDRTHVLTVSYLYQIPDVTKSHGFLKHLVNGWGFSGITTAQSGLPYSVYDFSGSIASQYFGAGDDFITNPLLAVPNGTLKSVQLQGTTGVNAGNPVLNAGAFGLVLNAPGSNGVPPCGPTTDEPSNPTAACDFSESGFSNTGRNTFRAPFQVRFDFSVFKNFRLSERFKLRYDAQFFNIFNHPSFDAPNNNLALNPCFGANLQTSPANGCQWAGNFPAVAPSTTPFGGGTLPFGVGFIQNTLGSPRFIQMALHLTF
jgi:Carboxypeptidase regulatory-like domain